MRQVLLAENHEEIASNVSTVIPLCMTKPCVGRMLPLAFMETARALLERGMLWSKREVQGNNACAKFYSQKTMRK